MTVYSFADKSGVTSYLSSFLPPTFHSYRIHHSSLTCLLSTSSGSRIFYWMEFVLKRKFVVLNFLLLIIALFLVSCSFGNHSRFAHRTRFPFSLKTRSVLACGLGTEVGRVLNWPEIPNCRTTHGHFPVENYLKGPQDRCSFHFSSKYKLFSEILLPHNQSNKWQRDVLVDFDSLGRVSN